MSSTNLHLERDFVGYGPYPPHAAWPHKAQLAINFCINFEEGSEYSIPDGDAMTDVSLSEAISTGYQGRDLAAESMFEYGSRVGFWRLHRLFSERKLPATIFACALALERNPAASTAIREGNYDICAHGWRWERHQSLEASEEKQRIVRAVRSIQDSTGKKPSGWYCRYGPSVNTRRILAETGEFLYDSDSYSDDLPYWVKVQGRGHLVVPYSLVTNDMKFMQGNLATSQHYFEYLKDTFDFLYREGESAPKMMSVGLHLRVIGHPGRALGLQRFLDYIAAFNNVWVCTRTQIAEHWSAQHPFVASP